MQGVRRRVYLSTEDFNFSLTFDGFCAHVVLDASVALFEQSWYQKEKTFLLPRQLPDSKDQELKPDFSPSAVPDSTYLSIMPLDCEAISTQPPLLKLREAFEPCRWNGGLAIGGEEYRIATYPKRRIIDDRTEYCLGCLRGFFSPTTLTRQQDPGCIVPVSSPLRDRLQYSAAILLPSPVHFASPKIPFRTSICQWGLDWP